MRTRDRTADDAIFFIGFLDDGTDFSRLAGDVARRAADTLAKHGAVAHSIGARTFTAGAEVAARFAPDCFITVYLDVWTEGITPTVFTPKFTGYSEMFLAHSLFYSLKAKSDWSADGWTVGGIRRKAMPLVSGAAQAAICLGNPLAKSDIDFLEGNYDAIGRAVAEALDLWRLEVFP